MCYINIGNPKEYILLNKAINELAKLIPAYGTTSTTNYY